MKFLAAAAGLVAAVSAYSYPTPFDPTANGAAPSGNAIYTPDTQPATLDVPYTISWDPTTPGPIALVLCKGPSTDCEPMLTIADSVANSGSFSWTPSGLDPSATSSGGYGIMLIDYTTEAYQYSTQFGILANPNATTSSTSASASVPATSSTTTIKILPSGAATSSSAVQIPTPSVVTKKVASTTYICPESSKTPLGTGTVSAAWTTSATGNPSVPTAVPSNAPSQPAYPVQGSAAPRNMISYGAMGAVAGLAALLAF